MKSLPLVSILTPCKNSLPYLKECLDSVLRQDYPYIEHVVQDGNSTDGSLQYIKHYAQSFGREKINWQSKTDHSETEGLNHALKRSKGEIIFMLNSDDILLDGSVSWGVRQLQHYPTPAVIYGDTYIINRKGTITERFTPADYDYKKLLSIELVPPAQGAFIRRKPWEKVGFFIDTTIDICPDYELWVRLGQKYDMKYIPGYVVSKYRYFHKNRSASLNEIDKSFLAKSTVLNRVFQNPQTPAKIRALKQRTDKGLRNWVKSSKAKIVTGPPLVSIVTTCVNSAKYLEECVKSVQAQDYEKVEHIIQDGGSEDSTVNLLKKYSRIRLKHSLKWVSEKDNGQSDGLNKALKRSKGDIILVLNADDMLLPNACSWGVEKMGKNKKYAVVYGDEYIINEKGEITAIYVGKSDYTYPRLFCVELVPPAQAAFIRRSMLEAVGLGADANLSTCPDFEMWVRLGVKFPFKHEFGIVCKYRHHVESEGRKPELVDKMVEAKLSVINKVLNRSKTPLKIKKLKRRAYAGLYHWAANSAHSVGAYRKELSYLIRSLLYRPQLHKIIRLIRFIFKHVPNLIFKATPSR